MWIFSAVEKPHTKLLLFFKTKNKIWNLVNNANVLEIIKKSPHLRLKKNTVACRQELCRRIEQELPGCSGFEAILMNFKT